MVDEAHTFDLHVYAIIIYMFMLLFFGLIRTLVAMATFHIVVVIPIANSQVSVYRTIGPLVFILLLLKIDCVYSL